MVIQACTKLLQLQHHFSESRYSHGQSQLVIPPVGVHVIFLASAAALYVRVYVHVDVRVSYNTVIN